MLICLPTCVNKLDVLIIRSRHWALVNVISITKFCTQHILLWRETVYLNRKLTQFTKSYITIYIHNNVSIVRFDCCCFSALAPSLSSFFLLSFFHSWRVGSTALLGKFFPCPPFHHQLIRLVRFRNLRSFQSERAREKRKGERSVLYSSAAVTLFIFSTSLFLSIQFFFLPLSFSSAIPSPRVSYNHYYEQPTLSCIQNN